MSPRRPSSVSSRRGRARRGLPCPGCRSARPGWRWRALRPRPTRWCSSARASGRPSPTTRVAARSEHSRRSSGAALSRRVHRGKGSMTLTLSFLGGAGTVTGSRYALEIGESRVLVDCGLFQGLKQLRLRNWAPFPVPPKTISEAILTHAHLDHSAYLPRLVRHGFAGKVHCSEATRDLCEVLLRDSAHLQEQDAEYANRRGFSKHKPALPLYTVHDAERALGRLSPMRFDEEREIGSGFRVRLRRAGHLLGAGSVECTWQGTKLVFSGDLGRYDDPMLPDPSVMQEADYLVVESTYGNRRHDRTDPQAALAEIIELTTGRGGTVIIPAFAVGRAQTLLYHLERLKASGRLTNVPIFLNSPMAFDASDILCRHMEDQKLSEAACKRACGVARTCATSRSPRRSTKTPCRR